MGSCLTFLDLYRVEGSKGLPSLIGEGPKGHKSFKWTGFHSIVLELDSPSPSLREAMQANQDLYHKADEQFLLHNNEISSSFQVDRYSNWNLRN